MFDPTLKHVAETLVRFCREGREAEGLRTLYAEDAVSIEATAMPGSSRETMGRSAIQDKHDWWDAYIDVKKFSADGPYLHGDDKFSVIFEASFTFKETGEHADMKEVAVYTLSGGKIVREEFFYAPS